MWASKLCKNIIINSSYTKAPAYIKKTCVLPIHFTRTFSINSYVLRGFKLFNSKKILPNLNFKISKREVMTIPFKEAPVEQVIPKHVGYWLFVCAGMVYIAIVLGGYTRLTESGLSMVSWKFVFEKVPTTEDDWNKEFKKYQEYPEYKQLKKELTLSEFKNIWGTEYFHRNWGRSIGLAVILPSIFYWVNGNLTPALKKRVIFFNALVVAQGLMGWYMVKSGLEDRFHEPSDVPRVSQYRLATHLGLALVLFTSLVMTGLNVISPSNGVTTVSTSVKKIKMLVHTCKGMVILTAISGAFVAGLDAGLVYDSFPKMGNKWIPDDILAMTPVYRNFTENPTTVQFQHRILGITTSTLTIITCLLSMRETLPSRLRKLLLFLPLIAVLQAGTGIETLLNHVQTKDALRHQSSAILLLITTILVSHEFKILKYLPK